MPASERVEHRVGDRIRLGHAPRAHHAAGQIARARLNHAHTALAQNFEIGLRRRVVPHVHIHRRSNQDRSLRGQVHRGQKIVGDAMGEFGKDIGRRRSNNKRLGPLRLADVLDGRIVCALGGVSFVPKAGDDLVAGERGKGKRLDETGRRVGHHHMHFKSLPLQGAHQFRRFVGGDAARDADRHSHR